MSYVKKFGWKYVALATSATEAGSSVVTSEEMGLCPDSSVFIWSSEHGENITSEISLQYKYLCNCARRLQLDTSLQLSILEMTHSTGKNWIQWAKVACLSLVVTPWLKYNTAVTAQEYLNLIHLIIWETMKHADSRDMLIQFSCLLVSWAALVTVWFPLQSASQNLSAGPRSRCPPSLHPPPLVSAAPSATPHPRRWALLVDRT